MNAYDFHPEARVDLDEIWQFIRAENLDAADRVIAEILSAIRGLARALNGTRIVHEAEPLQPLLLDGTLEPRIQSSVLLGCWAARFGS